MSARWIAAVVIGMCVGHGSVSAATVLTVTFHGPDGQPAPIARARLLATAWGTVEESDLPAQGNVLRVDLDAVKPAWAPGLSDAAGFLYVNADGYAPIISNPFPWLSQTVPSTLVDFRAGRAVTIGVGETRDLLVTLRRPTARRIRLVDQYGRPVAGAKIDVGINWYAPSHCGFLNGREELVEGTTNAQGRLAVPDVDTADFGLRLWARFMEFANPNRPWGTLVIPFTRPETTIRVRRRQPTTLTIAVVDGGTPVAGAALWGDSELGRCGAGWGTLATSDARGRIRLSQFDREEHSLYGLCYRGHSWLFQREGPIPARIDLAAGPDLADDSRCSR